MGVFGTHFKGGIYDYTAGKFEKGKFIPRGEKETDMGRQGQARRGRLSKTTMIRGKSSVAGQPLRGRVGVLLKHPIPKIQSLFMKGE